MDKNYDEQFLIIQYKVEANIQETVEKQTKTDEKQMKTDENLTQITEEIKVLTETTTSMMDQTKNSKMSPYQKDTLNPLETITVVPANRRDLPLDGGNSTKTGGMWTLKHEIISP